MIRLRIVDAFTDRPFAGNPAAVCLLQQHDWPTAEWMREIAGELHVSEAAFALPPAGATAPWQLRWFTPVVEDDLCGHATLATAHVLSEDGRVGRSVRFLTRSGVLEAVIGVDGAITLDFPAAEIAEIGSPAGLADTLGTPPATTLSTGRLRDVVAVFDEENPVRALTPDLGAIADIARRDGIRGITVTAPAGAGSGGYDFVSRFFSPADGIPEDAVTGSAHTALAPYWSARLGRRDLIGFQASRRGGFVGTRVIGDRVELTGRAVTVVDGVVASDAPVRS
jgi:PhzF family phenazine biosynthesis protein